MALYGGLSLQTVIAGHLKNSNFRIQEEQDWDHEHKIDFVVTRFPSYPKATSIGVQVTSRRGDIGKLSEFVAKNDPASGRVTVANKALYLEIDEGVNPETGGAELVKNVLGAYQFDERFAQTPICAATIQAANSGFSYQFFDPRGKPVQLPAVPLIDSPVRLKTPVRDLQAEVKRVEGAWRGGGIGIEGLLHTYKAEGGYGFIDGQDGSTYFVHATSIVDSVLLADLKALLKYAGTARVDYRVLFDDGGKAPQRDYRAARNVRLLMKC
jgi:hypothetical protein